MKTLAHVSNQSRKKRILTLIEALYCSLFLFALVSLSLSDAGGATLKRKGHIKHSEPVSIEIDLFFCYHVYSLFTF